MANRKASTPKAGRKALIVAINDYPDGSGNDLPSCVDDAKAMTELLKASPYRFQEIRSHLDAEATIQNVTDSLDWLFGGDFESGAQVNPEDRLVFYYSGHGFRTEQDGILRECLCLYDGFFFDKELNARTQNLPPGILTVVLDSCHSGGMEKRRFNQLSAKDKAPAERVKIKAWTPDREELAKADAAEEKELSVKRFGASVKSPSLYNPKAATKAAAAVPPAVAGETQVNGLLITACREDQTASASSSQTEGKSAFTFCLLNAFKKLGSQSSPDQLTSSKLFESVGQELEALQFKQTPELIESPNAPGLGSRSFVTLQAIGQPSGGAAPAASPSTDGSTSAPNQAAPASDTTTQPSTTTQGDKSMQATQSPVSNNSQTISPEVINQIVQALQQQAPQSGAANASTAQMSELNDEKKWGRIGREVARVVGGLFDDDKGFQSAAPGMPTSQASAAQPQQISPEVINQIVQALQQQQTPQQPSQAEPGKNFQSGYGYSNTATPQPVTDEKFLPMVIRAATVVPEVVRAVRGKDYQPGDPEDEQVLKAILPVLLPTINKQVASGQYRPANGGSQILPYPYPASSPALAR